MEVLTVVEESTTWLDTFDPSWLPSALHNDIQIVYRREKVGLKVGGVVGVVRLLDGRTLRIVPKVGEMNFVRMLTTCEGLQAELSDTELEPAGYGTTDHMGGMQLVARQFAARLMEIEERSLDFRRFRQKHSLNYAAGRVNPVQTVRRLRLRLDKPIVSESRVRSYDTAEHRVLAAASRQALALLSQPTSLEDEVLRSWWSRFGSDFQLKDLAAVDRQIASQKRGGSRGYYVPALLLATVLLWQAGITADQTTSVTADATLIRSATLFERYLRKLLIDRYSPHGILVTKGAGLAETSLFSDGDIKLVPDYVFSKSGKILCLGDAKYKAPDASDYYQLACYLDRYKVSTGVLLAPDFERAELMRTRHDIPDGRTIWVVSLPLRDLDAIEQVVASLLLDLAVSQPASASQRAAS